jgi:hypothetical protein
MPDPRTALATRPWLAVAGAGVLLAVVVALVLALQSGSPGSFELPAYLDPANPRVQAAKAEASSEDALLAALSRTIVAAYPPSEDLWTTSVKAVDRRTARQLWDDGRQVQFGRYPPFAVPEDPTWAEDPYGDLSWLRDYHSLSWLLIPARAYAETGDASYRDQVKAYLLDWIEDNPRRDAPSVRSWFDGAVGYRTDLIVELFKPVLASAVTTDELGEVLESLELHGRLLRTYLDREGLAGHNHNLFHSLSLYNLSVAFPELLEADGWRIEARERVSTLMPEMVAVNEGVSLEQAASYHLLAIQLFARADEYLSRFDDGLDAAERQTLESMTAFAALLLTPTEELPAIGDTLYGADGWQRLTALRERGISHPFTDYVLTHGRDGTRPPDASFFPTGGYAILRPDYSAGTAWASDLHLVVDTSPRLRVHGHDDVMNVLLTAFGHSLLVDSGGPYAYGSAERAAFVGATAHNVVLADDVSAVPGPVLDLVEVDEPDRSVVAGSYQVTPDVRDQRIVVLVKPDLVLIVDRLEATDGTPHPYRLLYHLPPDATVATGGTAGIVRAGPAGMGFRIIGSGAPSMDVITGQEAPLLGWVTQRHRGRTPAPTLSVLQTEARAWFVTVLAPSAAADARIPDVTVTERGDVLEVVVVRDDWTDRLEIAADGAVRMAER